MSTPKDLTVLGTAQVLVNKVTNTNDGGAKVTLEFSANDAELIKRLFQAALDANLILASFVDKNGS